MGQTQLKKLREFKKNAPDFIDRKDVRLRLNGNIIRVECEFYSGFKLIHEVEPSVFLDALKQLNLTLHQIKSTPCVNKINLR